VSVEAPPVMTDIEATYRARTPRSAELFARAARALPGGSTRTTVYFEPYPPYMDHGVGARVFDVDGNSYLDLLGNYTSLILGHAHPAVVAAVTRQLERGSAFGAPTEVEVALAEEIEARVDSVDELRFTNSGTEATMLALRLARVHTGRSMIAKFIGSYHGTHDWAFARTPGVPEAINDLVLDLPLDDIEGVERAIAGRARDLAAIIIEPVLGAGGMRPVGTQFLKDLRDLTRANGIVLIFDEIVSFRIGLHGAQGVFGVMPDLTTFGKIIGGGYPLAAVGGPAELMRAFDARRPGGLIHGGTFNGNPVGAAAGLATLTAMTDARFAQINALGGQVREALAARFERDRVDVTVTGIGSLFNLHVGQATLDAQDRPAALRRLHLALLNAGYYLAPRGMGAVSVPMTWPDLSGFVDVAGWAAAAVLHRT
jgi:glutamate-1-semialdehyde 2,1-aminomutase